MYTNREPLPKIWIFIRILKLIFFSLMLSCSDPVEPVAPKSISPGQKKVDGRSELYCLENFSDYLAKYFDGQLKAQEVSDFWECTARATEVFEDYAKKDSKGEYSRDHLQNFVSEYFWKDIPTDKQLLNEVFYLKKVLFGGSDKSLTTQEFYKIRKFIKQDLHQLTQSLRPHIPVLFSGVIDKKSNLHEEDVNAAATAFKLAFNDFSKVFERGKRSYSFVRLSSLLSAIQPFVNSDNPESRINNLNKFVPIIQETKVLLVGPQRDQILSSEWGDFFGMLSEAFVIWLRFENFLSEGDLTEGASLNQFTMLVTDVLTAIEKGLQNRPQSTYSAQEAKRWIQEIDQFFGLPFELEMSLVDEYWPWLTDKLLQDETTAPLKGLTPAKVRVLKKQFLDWSMAQEEINKNYGPYFEAKIPQLERIGKLLDSTPFSLSFDSLERVVIPNLQNGYDRKSLTYLNVITLLVEWLVDKYSAKMNNSRSGLTIPETADLINELKNLLVYLNFMEPNDEGFVNRLYRDTSVFVPQANGDDFIDSVEFSGFLHFVFSGLNNLNLMNSHNQMLCLDKVSLAQSYNADCLQKYLTQNLPEIVDHLPLLKKYHQNLLNDSGSEAPKWVRNLLETVSFENLNRGYLTEGEVLKLHVLFHYIETFIYRFDANKSGNLDPKEVNDFLDKFMTPISKLMGQEGVEDFVRSFFTYVSKYQKSPLDTSDHASSLRFHVWSKTQSRWEFEADRFDLSFVLAVLGRF